MTLVLDEAEWRSRQATHEARVDAWVQPHLWRRSRGERHPVEDFLFTYYSYRPARLRRWGPGVGVRLTGAATEFGAATGYAVCADGSAMVDCRAAGRRRTTIEWIRDLLVSTAQRPPMLGCFGLHEWAMTYRLSTQERRHPAYPLRLGARGTDQVVERHRITCTHYDAFRFFTDDARPRNSVAPSRDTQQAHEQPGCLHAAMDCYKYAYKLAPFGASELVADCFELARDVRAVDMAASPYDLSSLGIEPIRIETSAGKAAYIAQQRAFAPRTARLRERLVDVCDAVLGPMDPEQAATRG
ncbi:MAG: 3-methyladenine DNA glycosylase [Nocardioidaceae bacterium]